MKKILLTLLAVLTLSSLSAQNKGTNQMRVLWVEIEESNTSAQITGTNAGNTYAGYTCGDWTHNNTVPFPMADDRNALNTCAGLYEGSVPTVFFIAPNGYYRSIYGEADGISHFDTAICNSHMVDIMNNYPRSGQAPVISGISIPGAAAANANVTFKVEYISVDAATVEWTFQDGNPATASTATATCSWSTPGTYTVTVTVTNANGSASETGTISILNYISLFDFESNGFNAWTTVDADGDGENWGTRSGGHESSTCITSASWTQAAGPLTPNNWAFSPAITLPNESGLTLTWWDQGQDPDYAADIARVVVTLGQRTMTIDTDFSPAICRGHLRFVNAFGLPDVVHILGRITEKTTFARSAGWFAGHYRQYDAQETLDRELSSGYVDDDAYTLWLDCARTTSLAIFPHPA